MEKITLGSDKLYYGFPIYLLGYKDDQFGYNYSTMSSSYTLGNMLVIGVYSLGNAIKQIKQNLCFTINIPSPDLLKDIEKGGSNSGQNKFSIAKGLSYSVSEKVDAPIINECFLCLECEVVQIYQTPELGPYTNVIAQIKGRLIDKNLQTDGVINRSELNPVIFLGDKTMRSYRFLTNEAIDFGSFLEK